MSRRYGRKQRRAAREMIDGLVKDNTSLHLHFVEEARGRRRAATQHENLVGVIKAWDADIRALLGPYTSFAVNDITFRVDHVDQIREVPIYPQLGPIGPAGITADSLTYHVQRIYSLIAELSEGDRVSLQQFLMFSIREGSDTVDSAYIGMSQAYWNDLVRDRSPGRLDRIARRMTEDLIRLLTVPKKKKAGPPLPSENWVDRA